MADTTDPTANTAQPSPTVPPPTGLGMGLFSTEGGVDCGLRRKTPTVNAVLHAADRYTECPTSFCQATFCARSHDENIPASIPVLLTPRQPATIIGRITKRIILALNCVALWHRPHIGQEIRKFAPAFADGNAAPSIVGVCRDVWVVAPTDHVAPAAVFRAAFAHAIVAVRAASVPRVASAAFGTAIGQVAKSDYFFFSTIASAFVTNGPRRGATRIFENKKPRVSLADFAIMGWHSLNIPCGVFRRQRKLRYG